MNKVEKSVVSVALGLVFAGALLFSVEISRITTAWEQGGEHTNGDIK